MTIEALIATTPPILRDADGVFRVGRTRVRLETVITAFQHGNTPEEIGLKYPSLQLADVYAVITYYLQQPDDVAAYFAHRHQQINAANQELETRFWAAGIRERLLARRTAVQSTRC